MLIEAFETFLAKSCTPDVVRQIESSGKIDLLWREVEDSGFLALMAPEELGGAGMSWSEAFAAFTLLGRYAMPAPIAQTIAARAWMPSEMRGAAISLASLHARTSSGDVILDKVPYGLVATHVACEQNSGVVEIWPCENARRTTSRIPGCATATSLTWSERPQSLAMLAPGTHLEWTSAAIHAALLAGSMQRVLDICLQYSADRAQFGKPIGKFQAVQQQIAVVAEHVVAARIAAQLPFARGLSLATVAVAKARCSEAAGLVAAAAHAVHGAFGITAEYELQLHTRRLHEWRMADGAEAIWHDRIGKVLTDARGPDFVAFAQTLDTRLAIA
ncbi:acyl-CoA dehydrogenase family protein [Variovorax sp. VNK109]|uniref:acyl-CoA dehydrogenase family protein n=1 Tax=Variovorax sp. VNK109 TaxID=3400919 RepID=UPI003C003DA1